MAPTSSGSGYQHPIRVSELEEGDGSSGARPYDPSPSASSPGYHAQGAPPYPAYSQAPSGQGAGGSPPQLAYQPQRPTVVGAQNAPGAPAQHPAATNPYQQHAPVPHQPGGRIDLRRMFGRGGGNHLYVSFVVLGVILIGLAGTIQGSMALIAPPDLDDFEKYSDPTAEYQKAVDNYRDGQRMGSGLARIMGSLGLLLIGWGLCAGALLDQALSQHLRWAMMLGAMLVIGLGFHALFSNTILTLYYTGG